MGRLTEGEVENALLDFDAPRANCERLSHGASGFLLAERLVRNFSTKLAAADALHLASAKSAGSTLATLDLRLADAARGQGSHWRTYAREICFLMEAVRREGLGGNLLQKTGNQVKLAP
jgi:hypothetical protein